MKPFRIFKRVDVPSAVHYCVAADTIDQAKEAMRDVLTWGGLHGEDNFVDFVSEDDELLAVDEKGQIILAMKERQFVDVSEVEEVSLPPPRFVGVDVVKNGVSIIGTSDDPWGLTENSLLASEAAEVGKAWVEQNPGHEIAFRFEGDVFDGTVYYVMPSRVPGFR